MILSTSYLSKVTSLPEDYAPVFIASRWPGYPNEKKYFPEYKLLAPVDALIRGYKKGTIDEAEYLRNFRYQLDRLNPRTVMDELRVLTAGKIPCLICYEKYSYREARNPFCHRHAVAAWFREYGYECEEFNFDVYSDRFGFTKDPEEAVAADKSAYPNEEEYVKNIFKEKRNVW